MASEWYWSRGQDRFGPVAAGEFVGKLKDGTVTATDLVWTDTMTEWKPAGSVPAVAKYLQPGAAAAFAGPVPAGGRGPAGMAAPVTAPATAAPVMGEPWGASAPSAARSVGYYNPAAGLPPRAAATLWGHAVPTGDTSDWPLDDSRVDAFRDAFKYRQAIIQSANLFKGLMALNAIFDVILVIVALFSLTQGNRGIGRESAVLVGLAVLLTGITVLYGFAWKATLKSKRWAPITATVLLSIGTAFSLFSTLAQVAVAGGGGRRGDPASGVVGLIFTCLLGGAFIYVSAKAISAIPKYLATPAWCQELLSKSDK